jgi:hypothetical protein
VAYRSRSGTDARRHGHNLSLSCHATTLAPAYRILTKLNKSVSTCWFGKDESFTERLDAGFGCLTKHVGHLAASFTTDYLGSCSGPQLTVVCQGVGVAANQPGARKGVGQ